MIKVKTSGNNSLCFLYVYATIKNLDHMKNSGYEWKVVTRVNNSWNDLPHDLKSAPSVKSFKRNKLNAKRPAVWNSILCDKILKYAELIYINVL